MHDIRENDFGIARFTKLKLRASQEKCFKKYMLQYNYPFNDDSHSNGRTSFRII